MPLRWTGLPLKILNIQLVNRSSQKILPRQSLASGLLLVPVKLLGVKLPGMAFRNDRDQIKQRGGETI
jgi:hypothetical protein